MSVGIVSKLLAHFTFSHTPRHASHDHHSSRTLALSTTEKCTSTQRPLPVAAFRNSPCLRRLSTACQNCLHWIGVKLSECTQCKIERDTVGNTYKSIRVCGRADSSATRLISLDTDEPFLSSRTTAGNY